jgi:AraC family transcriptional regulator, positive regulator of tynA and feaB
MTETLFAFDQRNYRDCQNSFRGPRNQEYYLGDYSIEAGSVIDVRAERKAVGACSIIRLRSKTRLFFRRSWSHMREDGIDVAVLWFVKRGRLHVSHQCGETVAKPGDFVVTRSMTPFTVECLTDESAEHEVLHMLVPAHVFRKFVTHDVRTGFCVPAQGRAFALAERILVDVFEDAGRLEAPAVETLVDAALSVLSGAIREQDAAAPTRQTISEKRLQDVLKYIEVHLSDSKLSSTSVATGCGISTRYLSFLLNHHGTPFSTLVWDKRLKVAAQWLASSRTSEASISEIAYRVGFKCPAHFSRMFKRNYQMSPRQYRAARLTTVTLPPMQMPESGAQLQH